MPQLGDRPDFRLRWPREIAKLEFMNLIGDAATVDASTWDQEVETLLRQSFSTGAPLQEFQSIPRNENSKFDNEPF